jgi:hypothetical protein
VTLDHGYHPQVPQAMADPPAPEELRYARAHAGSSRVMGADKTFYPNLADRYDVLDSRAHDHPAVERYQQLFRALGGGPPNKPIIGLNNTRIDQFADLFAVRYVFEPWGEVDRNRGALPRAFMAYSWRRVTTANEALYQTLGSEPNRARDQPVIEFAPPVQDGSSPPAGPVRFTVDRDQRVDMEVNARRRGYLVLHDTFYPGWRATVDGISVPILAANFNFRAVPVPAGAHTVSFRYRPASVIAGAVITALTAIAMVAAGGALWLRRRRRS